MITPYLTFDGDCQQAVDFYTDALNSKVQNLMKMGDAPANPAFPLPEGAKDRIMQVTLDLGNGMIMRMSDTFPGKPFGNVPTDRISFGLRPKTAEEAKAIFEKLSVGGTIEMPPSETFFSKFYTTFVDKFGIRWQLAAE